MEEARKKPPISDMKGLNVDNTKIQKSNDLDLLKDKVLHSRLGKEIVEKTKEKSIFNTKTLKQVIQSVENEPPLKKLVGNLVYEKELTILFAPTGLGNQYLQFKWHWLYQRAKI